MPVVVLLAFVFGGSGGGTPRATPTAVPSAITSSVPDLDQATEAICDPVLAAMPVDLAGPEGSTPLVPIRVTPGGPSILAWGDPLVVLRCGVGRPADLRSDVQYQPIALGALGQPQVSWLATQSGNRVTWTTIDRSVYLQVTVDAGDTDYVQTVSAVIARELPDAVCKQPEQGDPPGTVYCGDRP